MENGDQAAAELTLQRMLVQAEGSQEGRSKRDFSAQLVISLKTEWTLWSGREK